MALAVFSIIAWEGGKEAVYAWKIKDYTFGVVELPLGPAKMVVPLGCGLLCLRLIIQIGDRIMELTNRVKPERISP